MRRTKLLGRGQCGAALLMMMLAIILATSTILLLNLNRDELRVRRSVETAFIMATAKKALLDYVVLNPDLNPGRAHSLPCPDIDDSGGFQTGAAHTTACGAVGVAVLGRIPWRTLGVKAAKGAGSACLWYGVSGSYKDAGGDTSPMINSDSNGQFQLWGVESGRVIEGLNGQDRAVAVVIAAMRPVAGQTRPGISGGDECAPASAASNYLESDSASGISNATLSGTAEAIELFAVTSGEVDSNNDRFLTISRREIEQRINRHAGFQARMRSLGLALASCVAHYAATNPAGVNDKRLPWPAAVSMTDYRPDGAYDDVDVGLLSGRLPDIVGDSNIATGNSISRVLSDCDPSAVPQWTPAMLAVWQNWKDHFFYAVANAHMPSAATPSSCGSCLTVNGSGQYAAVLVYSNSRLSALGQLRNAPPIDTDSKGDSANYLEAQNASNIPGSGVLVDYASGPQTTSFNDLLFCIDQNLVVSEC